MIFEYMFRLPVTVDQAWPVLLDVYRVAPCMPGAAIESGEGDDFVGRIKVRLGPVEMIYRGDLHFTHRDDAEHELVVEGAAKDTKGGGGAKAKVTLKATPDGQDGCHVAIHSDYTVSGKAAQFGRGVMEEVGEKLMNEFATRLNRLILEDHANSAQPSAVASLQSPVAVDSGPAAVLHDNDEALDIGSAAGWAVARRLLIGGAIALGLIGLWWVFRS
nr:L448 [uncultured bacterium]